MKKVLATAVAMLLALSLAGCGEEERAEAPPPFPLTEEAIGRYCGMNVLEHPGPKAQIILGSIPEPIWFSTARDAIAFTMLPEEPKDVAAIYVSDMAKAASWDDPGAENWIDARQAYFVIGSQKLSGMGAAETVPFSDENAAARFARENGGQVVSFDEIPADYVLASGPGSEAESGEAARPHTVQ